MRIYLLLFIFILAFASCKKNDDTEDIIPEQPRTASILKVVNNYLEEDEYAYFSIDDSDGNNLRYEEVKNGQTYNLNLEQENRVLHFSYCIFISRNGGVNKQETHCQTFLNFPKEGGTYYLDFRHSPFASSRGADSLRSSEIKAEVSYETFHSHKMFSLTGRGDYSSGVNPILVNSEEEEFMSLYVEDNNITSTTTLEDVYYSTFTLKRKHRFLIKKTDFINGKNDFGYVDFQYDNYLDDLSIKIGEYAQEKTFRTPLRLTESNSRYQRRYDKTSSSSFLGAYDNIGITGGGEEVANVYGYKKPRLFYPDKWMSENMDIYNNSKT